MKSITLAAIFVVISFAAEAGDIAGKASVIDGDTLEIHGTRIRMQGIDAPESVQLCERGGAQYRCGQQAANYLDRLIADRPVRCMEQGHDRYGRTVAVCRAGEVDLNQAMVAAGWAVAYRQYSKAYIADEETAKRDGKGIWAGTFQHPAEFRRAKREGVPSHSPAKVTGDCPIKGNISSKGERIYHLPGSDAYGRTRIDKSKGEMWFCSEAEAVKAGWRPAGKR